MQKKNQIPEGLDGFFNGMGSIITKLFLGAASFILFSEIAINYLKEIFALPDSSSAMLTFIWIYFAIPVVAICSVLLVNIQLPFLENNTVQPTDNNETVFEKKGLLSKLNNLFTKSSLKKNKGIPELTAVTLAIALITYTFLELAPILVTTFSLVVLFLIAIICSIRLGVISYREYRKQKESFNNKDALTILDLRIYRKDIFQFLIFVFSVSSIIILFSVSHGISSYRDSLGYSEDGKGNFIEATTWETSFLSRRSVRLSTGKLIDDNLALEDFIREYISFQDILHLSSIEDTTYQKVLLHKKVIKEYNSKLDAGLNKDRFSIINDAHRIPANYFEKIWVNYPEERRQQKIRHNEIALERNSLRKESKVNLVLWKKTIQDKALLLFATLLLLLFSTWLLAQNKARKQFIGLERIKENSTDSDENKLIVAQLSNNLELSRVYDKQIKWCIYFVALLMFPFFKPIQVDNVDIKKPFVSFGFTQAVNDFADPNRAEKDDQKFENINTVRDSVLAARRYNALRESITSINNRIDSIEGGGAITSIVDTSSVNKLKARQIELVGKFNELLIFTKEIDEYLGGLEWTGQGALEYPTENKYNDKVTSTIPNKIP